MTIKVLYAILVLSTTAVIGVALAIYIRVRRHFSGSSRQRASQQADGNRLL